MVKILQSRPSPLTMLTLALLSTSIHAFNPALGFLFSRPSTLRYSTPSNLQSTFGRGESDQEEQVVEAIRSLVDYHEGSWTGKATSFTVTPDVAAGIVNRKVSPEYTVSVKLGLDEGSRDYALTETITWNDSFASIRSLILSESNMDVDSVDASYSLDSKEPKFPPTIIGTDNKAQFMMEHCIAASEDKRVRLLVFYGVDLSLMRIAVCEEARVKQNDKNPSITNDGEKDSNKGLSLGDLLEMQDDVDRLVDKIAGDLPSIKKSESNKNLSSENEDALRRLQKSISANNEKDVGEDSQSLSLHTMSLVELTSGVWLGDAIIRDFPMVADSIEERDGKGFGPTKLTSVSTTEAIPPFGSWSVGVQKVAFRWLWNFGEEIRQNIDIGKAMGAELSDCLSVALSGSVYVNESLSRRIPKEDRMVFIDWNGDNVGFMLGPCKIQVPRYIHFDQSGRREKPFFSEFGLFQSTKTPELTEETVDEAELPDVICSKISRVYNFEGKLKQGCTSFYTLKRFGEEIE
jgi:hypothetical protein